VEGSCELNNKVSGWIFLSCCITGSLSIRASLLGISYESSVIAQAVSPPERFGFETRLGHCSGQNSTGADFS
jgi:hypothetical protein